MEPVINLNEVTVKGQTKRQELSEVMSDYRKQGTFYDGKPSKWATDSPSSEPTRTARAVRPAATVDSLRNSSSERARRREVSRLDPAQFFAASRLVIVAGKGGVGKTTVSAALASAAARRRIGSLIVEVEGKSGLASMFGKEPFSYDERHSHGTLPGRDLHRLPGGPGRRKIDLRGLTAPGRTRTSMPTSARGARATALPSCPGASRRSRG